MVFRAFWDFLQGRGSEKGGNRLIGPEHIHTGGSLPGDSIQSNPMDLIRLILSLSNVSPVQTNPILLIQCRPG